MKPTSIFSLLALFFFLFAACNENEPKETTQPFPFLKVGNEWVWENFELDTNGEPLPSVFTTLRIDTMWHVDSPWANEVIYAMYDPDAGYWDDWVPIFGYNLLDSSWFDFARHWRWLYWNCHIGQQWNWGTDFLIFELISLSEIVEVPAGKFDCIKIKWWMKLDENVPNPPHRDGFIFLSRKFGLIKQTYNDIFSTIIDDELKVSEIYSIKQLISKNF